MSRKLIVTKETEADILNGYLSYEEKQESIGLRLLEELNRPSIEFYPIPFYHEVKTDIRRAVTHTFPYLVFQTFDEHTVHILAVIHGSQDPVYINERFDA